MRGGPLDTARRDVNTVLSLSSSLSAPASSLPTFLPLILSLSLAIFHSHPVYITPLQTHTPVHYINIMYMYKNHNFVALTDPVVILLL